LGGASRGLGARVAPGARWTASALGDPPPPWPALAGPEVLLRPGVSRLAVGLAGGAPRGRVGHRRARGARWPTATACRLSERARSARTDPFSQNPERARGSAPTRGVTRGPCGGGTRNAARGRRKRRGGGARTRRPPTRGGART